jgi:hypothetical protein
MECQCHLPGHQFQHQLHQEIRQVLKLVPAMARVIRRKRRIRRLEPIEFFLREECERDMDYIAEVTDRYMSSLEPTGPTVRTDHRTVTQLLHERRLAREQP